MSARTAFGAATLLSASVVVLAAAATVDADCACRGGRSPASRAALELRWEDVSRVSPEAPTATTGGARAGEAPGAAAPLAASKPICVYVYEPDGDDEQRKFESIVLKSERVALGLKAFRTVRIRAAQAALDPLLAERGRGAPRLVVIGPRDGDVQVLDKARLSGPGVFRAIEATADRFYVERLEKVVRAQLEMLTTQDRLAMKARGLEEARSRVDVAHDGAKAEKELTRIDAEGQRIRQEQTELARRQAELWNLTLRSPAESA